MLRKQIAAREVVDADHIEIAARGKRREVAIEQHDGNAGFAQHLGHAAIGFFLFGHEFVGRKKNTAHAPLDELPAKLFRVLEADVGIEPRMRGAAPREGEIVDARKARDFAADELKNFRVPEIGNQQREHQRAAATARAAAAFRKSPRARAALDEPFHLQRAQGLRDGRARYAKTRDELRLARHAPVGSVFPGSDVGPQLARDFEVFWAGLLHGG